MWVQQCPNEAATEPDVCEVVQHSVGHYCLMRQSPFLKRVRDVYAGGFSTALRTATSLVQFPMQTQTSIKTKQGNIERMNFIFNQSQYLKWRIPPTLCVCVLEVACGVVEGECACLWYTYTQEHARHDTQQARLIGVNISHSPSQNTIGSGLCVKTLKPGQKRLVVRHSAHRAPGCLGPFIKTAQFALRIVTWP